MILRQVSVAAVVLSLPFVLVACDPGSPASAKASQPDAVRREIRDLITALTPAPATALPVEKSDWHRQRKATLERLRVQGPEYGLEALRVYREEPPSSAEARAGLLDVAAHCAPEAATPVLVQLVTTFGEHDHVRDKATEYLGECVPEKAVEVLEPLLAARPDDRTYPPEETILSAWMTAYEKLELDPIPVLCAVATDLRRAQEVRHLATRALGRHDGPQSRQALQSLMVESSGNAYIRRLATQSLRQLLPQAEFCKIIETVQSHEADPEFIYFLESTRESACRNP
jgi:hypothetical protein